MVSTKFTLLALAATLSAAAPADPAPVSTSSAIVVNRCKVPVFLHFAGPDDHPPTMLDPSDTYMEPLIHDQNPAVGRAIKISTSATPGAPELTFAYDLEGDKVFYNLSPPNNPSLPNIIPDRTMVVTTSDTSKQNACPEIILSSGSQQLSPSGPNVPQSCSSRFDVVLVLCRDL